jgi:hypothetical protein
MFSLSILRFFSDSQSPETPLLSQNQKSNQKSKEFSSPEDRDRIRTTYNKTAYGRDVVIILLIKTRTELDIPLFGRISFKDIAVAKVLYACLSNIKKTQYKAKTEQIISSFLDHPKIFFNR